MKESVLVKPETTKSLKSKQETKKIRLALFGLGIVGSGVCKILDAKREEFIKRFGVTVEVAGICVQDLVKQRSYTPERSLLTDDPKDLLHDDSIDLVLELIGGRFDALNIIERSLEARKHVITANKLILAHELPRLKHRADRLGVNLFYSASVCGSVPVIKTIDELRIGDDITSLKGIVNGSTNFILTLMSERKVEYEEAIVAAREAGFLEADPTLDVSGADAAQKLSILTYHAFDKHLLPEQIACTGIQHITKQDIERAQQGGKVIKLIASSTIDKHGEVHACVEPIALPKTHLFSHTRDEFNALEIETRHAGPQLLYGKGAGSLPTASAVISDLIEVLKEY